MGDRVVVVPIAALVKNRGTDLCACDMGGR
jgi:hypothetical protein